MHNDELYGEKRLHELSFERTGKTSFKKVFNLLENLKKYNLDQVPYKLKEQLRNSLSHYVSMFSYAKSLNLNHSNPKEQRDRIIEEIEQHYEQLYTVINAIVPVVKDTDQSEIYTTHIKEQEEKAQNILQNIKKVAAESGVEKTSFHFLKAEQKQNITKKPSIGMALVFFLSTVISLVVLAWLFILCRVLIGYGYYFAGGFLMIIILLLLLFMYWFWLLFCRFYDNNYNYDGDYVGVVLGMTGILFIVCVLYTVNLLFS